MEASTTTNARLISALLLIGAALAIVANALHPFFPADVTIEEFLAEAGGNAIWVPIHLGVGVALVLLTVALVLLARHLRSTAGSTWATIAATLAVIGGAIWTLQLVALDGVAFPALAEGELNEATLAAAAALSEVDMALLSLSVFLYVGATFAALGFALDRADAFAPWIRWTAMVGGAAGLIVGLMMLLDVAATFSFVAFRVVAFATTIVAIGIGVELRKAPAVGAAPATATGAG